MSTTMRAAYKCAFLILIFCLSTVQTPGLLSDENNHPFHVNARGSYGSDGGFASSYAIDDLSGTNYAGAVVQFSARVLQGDNYQDASQWIFSSYAISNDGSKYKIQEGKNAVSDKVYFEWDIPISFPTGFYEICVYIDSIRDDDGWYGYEDYWLEVVMKKIIFTTKIAILGLMLGQKHAKTLMLKCIVLS